MTLQDLLVPGLFFFSWIFVFGKKDWLFFLALAVAAFFMGACASAPFAPVAPHVQYAPLPEYAGWYTELEDCLGLKGDFKVLRFYSVEDQEGATEFYTDFPGITGLYTNDQIYILQGLERDKPTVVHEMMHHILSYYISGEENAAHSDPRFFGVNACDFSA